MYYGWKIVAALFVILVFASGLGFYNHSVMLQALVSDKGLSVTASSFAVTIFFLASGLFGLSIAALLERVDVRWIIGGGALIASGSLFAIGHVENDIQLYTAYCFFGIGFAASGLLPATTLVTRWFEHRRATAMSLASTGLSVGGVLITPASALLISEVGISRATGWFACAYLLGVLPFIVVLKSRPSDAGLRIDGGNLEKGAAPIAITGTSFDQALKQRYFWGLSFAYLFLMLAQVGGIAHQYGLVGKHLAGEEAALALSVIPVFSIFGRLAGGFLIDRYNVRTFAVIMMALQSFSLVWLAIAGGTTGFLVALALFGITIGNLLMLQPLLIAAAYGQLSYSRIYGLSNLMTTLGVAAGPLILGFLYSSLGDYSYAYLIASIAGMIGLGIYLTSRHHPE